MKKLKFTLSCIAALFLLNNAIAQTKNNSHGVSNTDWVKYVNKTNVMLEKVDEMSFFNYVVVANGGDYNDIEYFNDYVKDKRARDMEELAYRVGTGVITDFVAVKKYLSSLQPLYATYFADYKTKRAQIISAYDLAASLRSTGGPLPTPFNCGSACTNPGFESGTGFWDYSTGQACISSSGDPCSLVAGFSSTQHVLQAVGANDPIVGAALPTVAPGGGGSASMMIGDGSGTGSRASRASISFTVDAGSTNFTYRYAVVLQDPVSGHSDPERPYFKVKLRDAANNILPCGDYEVIAKPPITGFFLAPGTTDVYYRPWTTVFVPLAAYIGQCVTLEFTTSDCTQGGHYGYAYIDADCSPSGLVTSSPAVCGGATITLSAPAGAASYNWTNTSAGGTTGIVGSSTTQTISVNAGGTYEVTMTSVTGSGCNSTMTINVPSNPSNPVANYTNTTACANTPTSFTDISTPADSINGWNWDFNNDGITDDTARNPTHIFTAAGSYPVTLTINWGPCNATFIQNVNVVAGNMPVVPPVATMCSNAAPFTIPTTSGTGGVWSGSGITDTLTGAFDPAQADTTNIITYTTTGMCSGVDTVQINVVPSAFATWTNTALCSADAPINLNSLITGTAGGTWSGTGVTGSTFNPAGLSGPVSVTYTVGSAPCVATSTQSITVTPTAFPAITSVPTLCSNAAAITLAATGAASSGGTWSGTGITNTTTGDFDPATATVGTNVITYTVGGACGNSDTVHVTVVASASPAWSGTSLCSYDSPINLNSLVTGTAGGTWSGTGVTGSTFNPSGLSGAISVTYTVGSSPCVGTQTHSINVTAAPNATITAVAPMCADASGIALSAAAGGGTWTGTGVSSSGLFNPATAGAGTHVITYAIAGSCPATDTVSITVLPVGNPAWTLPASICASGDAINLAGLVTGTAGGTFSGPGVTGNSFNPSGLSGNVTITYTTGLAPCANSQSLTIYVDGIEAAFTATPTIGDAPLNVSFTNLSTFAVSYQWTFGNGETSTMYEPSTIYQTYGDYTAMLIATNSNGCSDTARIIIHADGVSHLVVPNVFTPNGDGHNDVFQAIIADGLVNFEAVVYDRWGLKMYEWTNGNAGWNGQAKNGSDAPDGTYYYIIKGRGIDDKDYEYTGFISLIRQ